MQQSSATPSLHLGFWGLQKIVACSQPYLAVLSCIYSFWHGVIPTFILMIFTLVLATLECCGVENHSQTMVRDLNPQHLGVWRLYLCMAA